MQHEVKRHTFCVISVVISVVIPVVIPVVIYVMIYVVICTWSPRGLRRGAARGSPRTGSGRRLALGHGSDVRDDHAGRGPADRSHALT
jgi:hypothetical protein